MGYTALIDADGLECFHRLKHERFHPLLIDDAKRGLADIAAGRVFPADAVLALIQQRRIKPSRSLYPNKLSTFKTQKHG